MNRQRHRDSTNARGVTCARGADFRSRRRGCDRGSQCQPRRASRLRAGYFRRAFTLLEVLLALTLSVILLGAIFTTMTQSWRLTASGREEMERSQLARALARKIAMDVRSIVFVPPLLTDEDAAATGSSGSTATTSAASSALSGASTGGSSSGSGSTGGSTSGSTSTATATDTQKPSVKSIGIRGNAQRIEMHISRARRDLDFSTSVDGNKVRSHTSDLRVLTYQLSPTGTGLIRTEGDRLATLMVEEKGAAAASMSAPQVLAPEVSYLQFRFFDGAAWYPSWDSESSGRLPRALEVTIGFAPPKIVPGPLFRVAVSSSANQFRTVVLLPIADPLPEEFAP